MSIESLAISSVTLQRTAANAQDAVGGMSRTWINAQRLKARVQPLSGTENVRYGRDLEAVLVKMYIPSAPTIGHENRIQFAGNIYKILSVHNIDHLNHHTRLICELQR